MCSKSFLRKYSFFRSLFLIAIGFSVPFITQLISETLILFAPISITGQNNVQTLYRGEFEITLSDLQIDYSGDIGDLVLSILPGVDYEIVNGTTIIPSINYANNWPSAGVKIAINIQLGDGLDQSEVFPFEILILPPILALSYSENSCEGTISISASAYKSNGFDVSSFPFVFELFDSNGVLFESRTVDYIFPVDNSASVTFGIGSELVLDRDESYTLVVTDNLGRTYQRASGPIGEAYSLDFELNFAGLLCASDNNGVVEFIVFNAALPLNTFIITDATGNEVFSDFTNDNIVSSSGSFVVVQVGNLPPGSYELTILDRFTCSGSEPFEIFVPDPIIVEEEITPVSCPENRDGAIRLEITGGWSQPFPGNPRQQWTHYGVEWFTANGDPVGNGITQYIRDGSNQIIGVENQLVGMPTGSFYAEITDRGRLFEFPDTDPLACVVTTPLFLIEGPEILRLNSQFNDISCFGDGNGTIGINPTGGIPNYQIEWFVGHFEDLRDPIPGELQSLSGTNMGDLTVENLEEGDYAVLLRDTNGCFIAENFTISEPEELLISEIEAERINIRCFGESTGQYTVSIDQESVGPHTVQTHFMGGTPGSIQVLTRNEPGPFTYENMAAGNYQIIITDANGCVKTIDNILLSQPTEGLELVNLEISEFNGFQISCFGAADGSINFELTGSQGDVTYSWTGPAGFISNEQNLENLGPGSYVLQIADESDCNVDRTFILEEPEVLALVDEVSNYNGFQITCNGGSDGHIRLFPTGGNLDYSFSWTGTNGFSSTDQDLEGISAGTYEVTIQDANGCTITREYIITEPEGLEISELEEQRVNVFCFGQSTGEIHVSVSRPSSSPYNYYIQQTGAELGSEGIAEEIPSTEWVFVNLPAGIYELTVVDANGCTEQIDGIEITQPESGVSISAINISDFSGFQISCFGAQDGQIEVILSGGSGNYIYEWTGPNRFSAATSTVDNLGPGIYELTITDTNGCEISTGELEITEPDQLALNDEVSDFNGFGVSCFGGSDGYISISPSGGTSEYTISWSGPNGFTAAESRIDNLKTGVYNLFLEDRNGCFVTQSYVLTEPPLLEAQLIGTVDVLCFGEPTGGIMLDVAGGASPDYQFLWRRNGNEIGESGQNPTTLFAGNYEVTVTDTNGCAVVLTAITINEPPMPLEVVLTSTEVSCYNANDGSVTSQITGGVPPYQISWNFGSIQPNLTGIGPGVYEITVTDANACVVVESVTIAEVPVFEINPEVTQISCFGENNGSINLNLVGGQAPVRALWDHGPEQAAIFNLGPGEYSVTIVEGAGCEFRRTFFIDEPEILIAIGIVDDALECTDGQSGSINLTVSGGTPPYIYEWSNGARTEDLSNLTSGWYSVNVTDQAGCFSTQRFQVRRPQPIQVSHITYQEIQCEPRNIRDVFEINVNGGVAPYTINWSHGDVNGNGYQMSTEEPGIYFLTVSDAAGCEYTETFEVDNTQILIDGEIRSRSLLDYQAHLVNMDIEFINLSSGNIKSYYWDFGDGNASLEENPIHRYQEEGTYTVTLQIVDLYECEQSRNFEIEIWDHFLEVPNVFSPNRDGMNDYFFPKFLQIADINFRVVNKWGEVIFYTDELQSIGWDGRLNGDDAQVGNYVYQVSYHTLDGRFFTKTGVFLLMR